MTSDHSRGMLAYPKPVKVSKARKPLRRKRYMVKKAPRRLSRAGSDPAYLAWVRVQMCTLLADSCEGRTHAHHARHLSQGGVDRDAIPLCRRHHAHWHLASGPFGGLSRMERFAWSMRAIAETRKAWEAR